LGTLLEYRTRARELSNTVNDGNVTDTWLDSLANLHLSKVYDRLVDAGPPDLYASTTQFTTDANVAENALSITFRNLTGVWVVESDGRCRPIAPMPLGALGNYKAPTAAATIRLEYIPTPPVLEDDADTFDGVSGWDDLISNHMALDVMTKQQTDPSEVRNNIAREEQRITIRSKGRDRGPKFIADLDEVATWQWPYGWSGGSRISVYRLRGGNIELYEPFWGYP